MLFTEEHHAIRNTVASFIHKEVNPYVDQWEEEGIFPAHEVFKKAGDLGLLGISKPVEYGGMGLDYSYNLIALEEWGLTHCGSIPMALAVQTDMATPALARFGSENEKHNLCGYLSLETQYHKENPSQWPSWAYMYNLQHKL